MAAQGAYGTGAWRSSTISTSSSARLTGVVRSINQLLSPHGWRWLHEVEGERGETTHYLFRRDGRASIGLRARQSDGPPHDRYAVGIHRVAIDAGSRRAVDRATSRARERDVAVESGPQEYAYSPGRYAVFLHDPDGVKFELMSRPRPRTALWRSGRLRLRSGPRIAADGERRDVRTISNSQIAVSSRMMREVVAAVARVPPSTRRSGLRPSPALACETSSGCPVTDGGRRRSPVRRRGRTSHGPQPTTR